MAHEAAAGHDRRLQREDRQRERGRRGALARGGPGRGRELLNPGRVERERARPWGGELVVGVDAAAAAVRDRGERYARRARHDHAALPRVALAVRAAGWIRGADRALDRGLRDVALARDERLLDPADPFAIERDRGSHSLHLGRPARRSKCRRCAEE